MHVDDDGPEQTQATAATVMRYHLSWKHRDLDSVMALYHPDVQYNDFFQNRVLGLDELREYVRVSMPRESDEALEHCDRIRVDGNTAFIQYEVTLRGGDGLVSFRSSEAITVKDGLIWRVNEYASLVHAKQWHRRPSQRPAVSRLGLSPRQISFMAEDLQQYFERQQPYLDPELDLQRVAKECGYSRNQISYLLNQVLGQSFYRYVNQARLQHLLKHWITPRHRCVSTNWHLPPVSTRCRRSTVASASTPASRPRPTPNKFLCGTRARQP
jgi:AraC-like DNA-binding protein/ketosteroid isomerase-like protein